MRMDGALGALGTLRSVAGHTFLELLARDAELVEFEEPLRDAREARAGPRRRRRARAGQAARPPGAVGAGAPATAQPFNWVYDAKKAA